LNSAGGWSLAQLQGYLEAGGPVFAVLLAMSVLAVTVILGKLWQLYRLRISARGFVEPALKYWHQGHDDVARQVLSGTKCPIAQVMDTAMAALRDPRCDNETAREEVMRVATKQIEGTRSHLKILEVIAVTSPLLGLLGTVFGMIEAFRVLEAAGTAVDPAILSGGIWKALLTTAMGLSVAIPAIFALSWFEQRITAFQAAMEDAMTRVFTVYFTREPHSSQGSGSQYDARLLRANLNTRTDVSGNDWPGSARLP
jgi:biopolymer transport protein ExbB